MKYSFILEIDEISKDDMNELISVLSDNKIKFHVLKSDKELKENQKYKEVIEKVIDYINDVSRHTDNYFDLDNNLWIREVEILDILKEVEDK